MSKLEVTGFYSANFAVARGYPAPPGQEVEPFKSNGMDGWGYHIHGRRGAEGEIETWVDCVDGSAYGTELAWYGKMRGKLAVLTVGDLPPVIVMILDVKAEEPETLGASVGGLFDGSDPKYLLHARWKVQYPYGF